MDTLTLLDNFATVAEAPGGVQRLRDLVLNLAIRGQLVEQCSTDLPVSCEWSPTELRLKPEKLWTAAVFASASEIPSGWARVPLAQLGRWGSGGTPAKSHSEYYGGSIPWLVIGDLNDGTVKRAATSITDAGLAASSAQLIPVGAVLIAMYGSIGKAGIAGIDCTSNQAIAQCVPDPALIRTDYLFRLVLALRPSLNGEGKGAAQQNISQTILKHMLVAIPPLAEQDRIVAKVDELMGMCDELEAGQAVRRRAMVRARGSAFHALTSAETPADVHRTWERVSTNWPALMDHPDSIAVLRQVILQLAVQGKLARQDSNDVPAQDLLAHIAERQSDLKDEGALRGVRLPARAPWLRAPLLPSTWVWTTLGSVLRHCRNGSSATPNDDGVGYPILRISAGTSDPNGVVDLDDHKFTAIDEVEAAPYVLESGDMLACRFNGNLRFVGRVAIVPDHQGTYLHPDKLIRLKSISVDHRFLAIALNSTVTRQQIEEAASTTAGNIGINGAQFQALHIPLPPLAEQARIAEKVGSLLGLCAQLEGRMPSRDRLADRTADALVRHLSRTA